MTRLAGFVERRDAVFYDTEWVAPGDRRRLFGPQNIGDLWKTNLQAAWSLSHDTGAMIYSVGLRLPELDRYQEERILDKFIVTPSVADRPISHLFGNLCSTFRYLREGEEQIPVADAAFSAAPGYLFKVPYLVSSRMNFNVDLEVADDIGPPGTRYLARVFVFTVEARRVE